MAVATPLVRDVVNVDWQRGGVPGAGGTLLVPARVIGATPLTMAAVGDTLGNALDVGVFGQSGELTSLVFTRIDRPTALRDRIARR